MQLEYKAQSSKETLPRGFTVTVTVATGGAALYERFVGVSRVDAVELASGASASYGPFPVDSDVVVTVVTPRVSYTITRFDAPVGDLESLSANSLSWSAAHATLVFAGMPTVDPVVAGALWSDAGTIKISAGPGP